MHNKVQQLNRGSKQKKGVGTQKQKKGNGKKTASGLYTTTRFFLLILRTQLLQPHPALENAPVHCRRNSQCATNDGAESSQETRERLALLLPVDNLHR